MLWTDSLFIGLPDLNRIDGDVSTVASSEGLTLVGPNSISQTGQEDAANELMKMITSFGGYLNSGDLTANHLAAVLNVGIGNSVRQKVGLQQVVVTTGVPGEMTWLRQWAVFWVLRALYRAASARTTNDRYDKKINIYTKEQERLKSQMFGLGIPVITQPLVRPAAYYTPNSGSWGNVNLSNVAGSGTSTASVDVAITWVNASQWNYYQSELQPNNMESAPSDIANISLTNGNVLSVSISSLNPPTGQQDPAQTLVVVVSPAPATGWNLWVGPHGGTLYLQNSSPIPIATKSYVLPGNPTFSGYALPTQGQYADRRLSIALTRQRA